MLVANSYLKSAKERSDCTDSAARWFVRTSALLFVVVLLTASIGFADQPEDEMKTSLENGKSSVWRPAVVSTASAESLPDLESSDEGGLPEPILVPLPAPIIGAASGLVVAWLLRRRMVRV